MPDNIGKISEFCFTASYTLALALELLRLLQPRPVLRIAALVAGGAGLLAHTLFVLLNRVPLATPHGSLLCLAWVLAVFYFYGSIHHYRLAWGLFVLPVVLGLVLLAQFFPPPDDLRGFAVGWELFFIKDRHFWPVLHGLLLMLAAIGICVGFVVSVMYLVQVRRLRAKTLPGKGMQLLSLERLEEMNRRALLLSFPLLTVGLLLGVAVLAQSPGGADFWASTRILGTVGLWLVFAILLYLRYGVHARGTQVAVWTIVAFAVLLLSLVSAHPFVPGGGP